MSSPNIMGLFCEDIRDEKSGMFTLIGVFQDNVEIQSETGMIPKLCGYFRFSFPPDKPISPGKVYLTFPDGEASEIGTVDQEIIDKAIQDTTAQGAPLATVISRAILIGLRVSVGRIVATAKFGSDEYTLAALNFMLDTASMASPNASPQPSSQSPPTGQASMS